MISVNGGTRSHNGASPVVSLSWPRQMQPGDERLVANALRIGPCRNRIRVRFLFDSAVRVSGPGCVAPNIVEVGPSTDDRAIGLMFRARADSRPGCRVDVALSITRRRIVVWRAIGACMIGLLAVGPAVMQFVRWPSVRVSLSVSDAIVLTIPVGVILAGLVAWQRLAAVIVPLLVIELTMDECVSQIGDDVPHISVRASVSDTGMAQLDVGERAAWSDGATAEK